jgi:aminopeptidase N
VAFYQRHFGPTQVPGFVVAQIPALHGEAFPGLVNIPETSFSGPNALAEDQVFRAHEVAHQWWGYSVDGRTYHDHWLTEGFADFSALWYLQAGLKRNQDYFALLADWSRQLTDDQQMRPERGRLPGPIWLGYRNSTRNRPYDYVLMDYTKGAWVLHMLRTMMLDLDTMDDARFEALMRDFYRTYAGSSATTDDFRRVAERHIGQDLGWFFDEWVYGTGVPTFEFATTTVPADAGRVRVRCRVRTKGVPDGFQMPVVMRLEFPRDQFAWVRRTVTAPVTEFDLTEVPMEPARIVFNDIQSVLGSVKVVGW